MNDIDSLLKDLPPLDETLDADAEELMRKLIPIVSFVAIGAARALAIQNGGVPTHGRGLRHHMETPDGLVRVSIEPADAASIRREWDA